MAVTQRQTGCWDGGVSCPTCVARARRSSSWGHWGRWGHRNSWGHWGQGDTGTDRALGWGDLPHLRGKSEEEFKWVTLGTQGQPER